MNRRFCLSFIGLSVLLLAAIPGCGEQVEGYVHVDNGSDELIVVFVDGKQQARIGPGRCRRLTLPLGDRAFKVTRGDQVVYEQTHRLDLGNRPFRRPSYVLNPDQNYRYCEVEIVYTDEGYGDQDLSDLISMISHSTEQESETATETDREATTEDGEQPEETVGTEKEKRVTSRAIVREYCEISKNLVAMGDSAFFPVEHAGKLFQPLPTVVYSRHGGDQSRSTLARVPKVLHDYLAEAATTKKPTAEELDRLKVAQDVTISYIPFR